MNGMNESKYLYSYNLIEVIDNAGTEIHTPIVFYDTNAAPPEIGSIIDPGEFSNDGFQQYEVLSVTIVPRNTDDVENASDTTHVTIHVRKKAETQ